MMGSALAAGTGAFAITIDDGVWWTRYYPITTFFDFDLVWTEYFQGELRGSWTFDFEDGINQTPASVPLPTSAWLLFSGLVLFIGIRRHSTE